MFTASAESRLAAISNDVRVRVEDSKKKLMTVFPRRAGTFLMERVDTSLKDSAVSRMTLISSTDSSLMPKRSFLLNANLISGQCATDSRQRAENGFAILFYPARHCRLSVAHYLH